MVTRSSTPVEPANNGELNLSLSVVCLNEGSQGNTVSSQKNLPLQDRFAAVDFIKRFYIRIVVVNKECLFWWISMFYLFVSIA